ncbi:hypothetical protein [Mucilaginibacter pedocola]|uniref:Uncharacterized protein n=1 Tax=Mucilaginibacter pedocola TaxID=1792845 RepID=A0A1S9P991_9SPHI|nr:hypothetical protein [Mucilaginibacter pedocola]OOQ57397.1 hypothetical protein BC343_14960 [Mucilaginibacter pedocola]
MGFTKDQEKILSSAGYSKSQLDSNKWINGSHSAKASDGGSVTWNTDKQTWNGSGMSNTSFRNKAK